MHITLVTTGRVPCVGYGGRQRQVQWLASELAARGHDVSVLARETGDLPGVRLIRVPKASEFTEAIPPGTDLVHFQGYRFPARKDDVPVPFLNTPRNLKEGMDLGDANWCFISAFQAAWQGGKTFVHNGFPVDAYRLQQEKGPRLLFLSGIARPGKNLTAAIRLARRCDFGLDIAGGTRWSLLTRSAVRAEGAFLKTLSPRFRFHGIVDGEPKRKLLAEARALIFPIRVPETFGNVMVEAMLSGTPVLATPIAAVPEVVKEGDGFLFETDEDFGAALERLDDLDPAGIRERAIDRFSMASRADRFLEIYERILDGERVV